MVLDHTLTCFIVSLDWGWEDDNLHVLQNPMSQYQYAMDSPHFQILSNLDKKDTWQYPEQLHSIVRNTSHPNPSALSTTRSLTSHFLLLKGDFITAIVHFTTAAVSLGTSDWFVSIC